MLFLWRMLLTRWRTSSSEGDSTRVFKKAHAVLAITAFELSKDFNNGSNIVGYCFSTL
jgi:hypothetical protein